MPAGNPERGKSVLGLPLDYTVVDTETTGLSSDSCGLIEISGVKVRGGEIVRTFSSLLRPAPHGVRIDGEWCEGYVDSFIIQLTGITNEMLERAPAPETVLPQFAEFLGDDLILGHNVGFDVGFLDRSYRRCLGFPLRNDSLDLLRIARKLLPGQRRHRLADVSAALGVSYEGAHRAETDCRITNDCYLILRERALSQGTEEDFVRLFDRKKAPWPLRPKSREFDTSHPLYGKTVVITGTLRGMPRREAMQLVVDAGGVNGDSVTDKTDYLVVGSTDFELTAPKRDEAPCKAGLRKAGTSVISEAAFFRLLREKSPGR